MIEKGQGGVIASRGFNYQDYVALNMFLENYNAHLSFYCNTCGDS